MWIGLGFHPEEPVCNLVDTETGRPSFSAFDAERIDRQLDTVCGYLDCIGIDPCAVATPVQRRMLLEAVKLPINTPTA